MWFIDRGQGAERIDPVAQARDARYALRHFVEGDPRWGSRGRVRWSHHVVLAHTDLDEGFALPDLPRWQVSGRGDLAEVGGRVFDTTWRWQKDARPPSRDDVDLILEILNGRFPPSRDAVALADDREERAQRLTAEQANLLKVTRLLPRLEIRGGACSGKTVLAMQQARDLASGRLVGQKKRVAVVCYSYGLATYLRRSLLVGSVSRRPAFVGTFEDLGSTRRRVSPTIGGRRGCGRCGMRRPGACTRTRRSGSGCSPGSDAPRCRWCRWCWTTTCATPDRLPRRSGRWRRPAWSHAAGVRGRR